MATKKGRTTYFFFIPLFCCCFWIRDGKKLGSGINIPGSSTLLNADDKSKMF
jgi:hypothetical protein